MDVSERSGIGREKGGSSTATALCTLHRMGSKACVCLGVSERMAIRFTVAV